MNTFGEKPVFLFVDDLADSSSKFATDGKIVELFDTGCDARTPGGALKISKSKELDATIQRRGLTQIPNVRKPFSLSLRQDKTEVKKNFAGTCKSPKQGKPMTWNPNPKLKDTVSIKIDETELKTGLDPVEGNQSNAKGSQYSKRVSPEREKAKSNITSSGMFSKYGGRNWKEKLQPISSSIPRQCRVPETGSSICSTFEERAKTNSAKSATNPRMTSPTKTSMVTSAAALNHGVKKFVNRAVDKDSLSNCSRQLEVLKNRGASSSSKTGYSSRLPTSTGAAKFLCKRKPPLEFPVPNGTGREATIKPEANTALMKIVGDTDHEHEDKDLKSKAIKKSPTVSSGKQRDRLEGETTSKAKLSIKTGGFDNQNAMTSSSSRSKMTPSKVPLPRFGRNLLIGEKSLQKPHEIHKAGCRDSHEKLLDSERPATYSEKVPARPSAKCHNLTPHKNEENERTISFKKKISEPRTPSIVPKLMDEFRLQERRETEVSKCSPRSAVARSVISPEAKMEGGKMKTDLTRKPPSTSGLPSNQRNERLSRFSDRVQEVLDSKTPLLSEVTKHMGTNNRIVDRTEQNGSKIRTESVSLSGVQAVHENDEEVELRTIFEDTSGTTTCKPTVESPVSLSRTSTTKESKVRNPQLGPLATESKVPRPVVTKRIPRKEMARNFLEKKSPTKQEPSTLRGSSKSSSKSGAKSEAKPSTPLAKKSLECVPESENLPKEDEDEDVIPIMNPALYNIRSFATRHGERRNLENDVPRKIVHGRRLESWMDGHEQAYLKGRAIGLKVASMARAAKEDLKREYVRSGLMSRTPMSLPDKSQEIVDIGVSVIERALAEKENKVHSPSVRGDQVFDYYDFDKNTKWQTGQWFT